MNHDFSVFKNVPFGGNRKFQFRLSAYNVFNHPQRTPDDASNSEPELTRTARRRTRTSACCREDNKYGHRILQLAFKFYF